MTARMFERLAVSTAHRRIHAAFTDALGAPPLGRGTDYRSRERKRPVRQNRDRMERSVWTITPAATN